MEVPLIEIETHYVLRHWAAERGEQLAREIGAGALLILDNPVETTNKSEVILLPLPKFQTYFAHVPED